MSIRHNGLILAGAGAQGPQGASVDVSTLVPKTTTVNGHALSSDVHISTSDLSYTLESISYKHILFIGDSSVSMNYMESTTNFIDLLSNAINNFIYNGTAPTNYKTNVTKAMDFFGQTSTAIASQVSKFDDYTTGVASEPNVIFIDVGGNDILTGSYSTTTLKTNIRTIVNSLKSIYPNAKIVGFAPWHIYNESGFPDIPTLRTDLAAVYGTSDLNVDGFLDLSAAWTIENAATNVGDGYTGGDGIHPNNTGEQALLNLLGTAVIKDTTDIVTLFNSITNPVPSLKYIGALNGEEELLIKKNGIDYKLKVRDFLNDTDLKNQSFRQEPSQVISLGKGLKWNFTEIDYKPLLFSHYTDSGSVNATATTLYSDTIAANTLLSNGDVIKAEYSGVLANNSNTKYIGVYFNGSVVGYFVSTTVANTAFNIETTIIRESSSSVKIALKYIVQDGFTNTQYANITGLDFTTAKTLELHAQGTATNDVVAKMGYVEIKPL